MSVNRGTWFEQAKFGLFIHWGLYSELAGEWQGRQVPVGENAEWIMQKLQIPVDQYRQIAERFNPTQFDAQAWVDLAKAAGMRYLVITAKHHEGFAMYHSQVSDYNIVDATPFDGDPLAELAAACRDAGIRFCVYYSHREDWDHPNAYGNFWDYGPKAGDFEVEPPHFERYLEEKSKPQLRELLTGYGPLGLVWFDRGIYTQEQARDFADLVHELQPQCLVNGRVGGYEQELVGDYQDLGDNEMPLGEVQERWETPQTLNETWGYSRRDTRWKRPQEVIRRLVEIVGRGGNYLLNVGPTGEGIIPQASVEILRRVGAWLDLNGESIYGTTASPFVSLPFGGCTVRDRTLYLHVLDWPQAGSITLPGLRSATVKAYPLADPTHALAVTAQEEGVRIDLPAAPLDELDTVIVLQLEEAPEVDPPLVRPQEDGTLHLDYVSAQTEGRATKRFNRRGGFHISKWMSPEDGVTWHLDLDAPGTFAVQITYSARQRWAGRAYAVSAAGQTLVGRVEASDGWHMYHTLPLGTVTFDQPGHHTVRIAPLAAGEEDLMYLREVELGPE